MGVYRLWRDLDFAVGGLAAGRLADALGIPKAIATIGGLTFISGVVVAVAMHETLPTLRTVLASKPLDKHQIEALYQIDH